MKVDSGKEPSRSNLLQQQRDSRVSESAAKSRSDFIFILDLFVIIVADKSIIDKSPQGKKAGLCNLAEFATLIYQHFN